MNKLGNAIKREPLIVGAFIMGSSAVGEEWVRTGSLPTWPALLLIFSAIMRTFTQPADTPGIK